MSQWVPSSTAIKRSKAKNVDNDRLFRRRTYLIHLIEHRSHTLPNRIDFVMRAMELFFIEDVLQGRGMLNPDGYPLPGSRKTKNRGF